MSSQRILKFLQITLLRYLCLSGKISLVSVDNIIRQFSEDINELCEVHAIMEFPVGKNIFFEGSLRINNFVPVTGPGP